MAKSEIQQLKEERDKLERDVRSLVWERAELLRQRDEALDLVARFDPTVPTGRVRAFVADLHRVLKGTVRAVDA